MIPHLYIHIPFCNSICYYCDFTHRLYDTSVVDKWLNRLEKEIDNLKDKDFETIYLGGGTPSCLSLDELNRLLSLIKPLALKVKEYTIEINPESLSEEKIKLFKDYGINRFSIGVQTSNDDELKVLGRKHSFKDAKKCINLLHKYKLNNISCDLMYSFPTQTFKSFKKSIKDIINLDIKHISIYSLTIEDHTVFKAKGYKPFDEEIEAKIYEYMVNELKKNGFNQYEVANFSKRGYESKHNLGYWLYHDFVGLSLGASGKENHTRYTNTSSFDKYLKSKDIKEEIIKLTKNDEMFENIMMSLRLKKGLNIDEFNIRYNTDLLDVYKEAIKKNRKLLSINKGYLSVKNREILNEILIDFMD